MLPISKLSPDQEMATIASSLAIMPRSPWLASLGCTKNAGVPVEAKVAASFCPTWPLLPMPVTITRPLARDSSSTASPNAWPSCCCSAALSAFRPSLSSSRVRAADCTAIDPSRGTARSFAFATAFCMSPRLAEPGKQSAPQSRPARAVGNPDGPRIVYAACSPLAGPQPTLLGLLAASPLAWLGHDGDAAVGILEQAQVVTDFRHLPQQFLVGPAAAE